MSDTYSEIETDPSSGSNMEKDNNDFDLLVASLSLTLSQQLIRVGLYLQPLIGRLSSTFITS